MLISGPMVRKYYRRCSGTLDFKIIIHCCRFVGPMHYAIDQKSIYRDLASPNAGTLLFLFIRLIRLRILLNSLIAVGGEDVEIRDGSIYINGQKITRSTNCAVPIIIIVVITGLKVKSCMCLLVMFLSWATIAGRAMTAVIGFCPGVSFIGRADIIFWPSGSIRILNK